MRPFPLHSLLLLVFTVVSTLQAAPEKVLIIGDSMMKVTAHATQLELRRRGGVTAMAEPSIGSGLARLDALDWMAKAEKLVADFDPDVTMVWFGTNDYQPMQSAEGLLRPEDPKWMEEYSRRMGQMMDILTQRDGTTVYWLELPIMRDSELNAYVNKVNELAKAEADKRDDVEFFATNALLTRKPDAFTAFLIDNMGRPIKVREPDGIHLARPGADIVAKAFVKELF
jgi:hypothetical protein